ncbi:MAG: septum formation protein Maf [Thermococci archaeon]|nr:septum formation protein Maf [Thermococci archaeon]
MITLASKSPRRREILERFFPDLRVLPSDIEERLPVKERLRPVDLAVLKARDVYPKAGGVVVAADTMVFVDDVALGKPSSTEEAKEFLRILSGRTHEVVTGYAIVSGDETITGSVKTLVRFRELDESIIEWYVGTGEPMDKAGGYGIQGLGGVLIEGIEGDFYNVVGMPMEVVWRLLRLGFQIAQRKGPSMDVPSVGKGLNGNSS